jgi:16S rRNA (guanine527-N7)-methyltransferase
VKRLREVSAEFGLPAEADRRLEALLQLLAIDPAAPSAVTDPAEALDTHVADSLVALPLIDTHVADGAGVTRLVDIGSGAGFPGLPLAIARPQLEVDLLESNARKCAFIARAIERLEQGNADVVCARAEDWGRAKGAGRYAVACARALAPLATLVEYASPLLREGGVLVAWKGARDAAEEAQGAAAADALGMRPAAVEPVTPFAAARNRHLHVFAKTGPTPTGVPRRAGMARKRPFGNESSTPN